MVSTVLILIGFVTSFAAGRSFGLFRRGTAQFWYMEYLRARTCADILKRQLHVAAHTRYDAMYRVPPGPDRLELEAGDE